MARVTQLQTNFTAGEISPRLHGRVDIAKYQNGAEAVRDLVVDKYGGAKRRPSTLFVREVKDSTKRVRLIPFVLESDVGCVLEFGHLYMRVYKNGAVVESGPGVPYEIATPYTEAQLADLDYTQGADTMFVFHEAVEPYKLLRIADTNWTLSVVTFVNTPFDETGTYPAAQLTPGMKNPVGEEITLVAGTLDGTIGSNVSLNWAAGVVTVEKTFHGYATGDVVTITEAEPTAYQRAAVVITVTGPDHFTYPMPNNPGDDTKAGKTGKYTGTAIFTAADVGKSVKINGGVVKITGFTSTHAVTGIIKQELSATVPAPQDSWSLHAPAWSAANGYPRSGCFFEQRLICAGSPEYPQTIWGSVTGAYLDFQQGVADDDGFALTIASDVMNPIEYVASNRVLIAMTGGGEYTVHGGQEKPLTPTNVQIKSRSNYGCARVRPVRVGEREIFVQRAGRKIRKFGYDLTQDTYNGPDLSVLAEHLTEGGVAEVCWQQEPDALLWVARADGELLSITMDDEQDVIGWSRHEGFARDGAAVVESLTSIPVAGGDEVWLAVRRTVGGVSKRYIERMATTTTMDCGMVASGPAAATWGGLAHLNGETVHAVADGFYVGAYTVAAGSITLTGPASAVNIGLRYVPRLKLLPPEIQTGMGSASGNAMRTSEITIRFFETTGCSVNGNEMTFRRTGAAVLDQPPQQFTGVKRVESLGFERGTDMLEITQEEPMPFHILSVTRKFTVNDG
jgi:hypothetical protein